MSYFIPGFLVRKPCHCFFIRVPHFSWVTKCVLVTGRLSKLDRYWQAIVYCSQVFHSLWYPTGSLKTHFYFLMILPFSTWENIDFHSPPEWNTSQHKCPFFPCLCIRIINISLRLVNLDTLYSCITVRTTKMIVLACESARPNLDSSRCHRHVCVSC